MHLKCVQFTAYQLYLNLFKVPGINFIRNIQDLTEENLKSLPKKKKKTENRCEPMERQTLLFRGNAQFHKSGAIKIPRDIDSDNYLRLKMIPKLF